MEQWESVIENYPPTPDLKLFCKALQIAGKILRINTDLAPFEIEWIIQTLLYQPINVINTIKSNNNNGSWCTNIEDALKRMNQIVTEQWSHLKHDNYQSIVDVCLLPLDPQTRKHALECLTSVCRRSPEGARDVSRHIAALQEGSTAKTPLAILVGAICEHHPDVVERNVDQIWRTYLILLEKNKNTATVTQAVLRGIAGLFKDFGMELPMMELNDFYDRLSSDYIKNYGEACQRILEDHSSLFREKIANDRSMRMYLWKALAGPKGASFSKSIRSVYQSLSSVISKNTLKTTLEDEVVPWTVSPQTQVKYTALRVISDARAAGVSVEVTSETDVQTLEYEMRSGTITYDTAEAICWYIESSLPECERLLQAAILFYDNIPSKKRKEIVTYGLLRASPDVRTAAVIFLATETCQTDSGVASMEKYLPLWRELLEIIEDSDVIILNNSRYIFEDFMGYFIEVLEAFLEDGDVKNPPDKLVSLLRLCSHVLSFHSPEKYTNDLCSACLPLVTELIASGAGACACACAVAAGRGLVSHVLHSQHFDGTELMYKCIQVSRCRDEALLCESCLMLVSAPDNCLQDVNNVLLALQVLFSRQDAEPSSLSEALRKFETLLERDGDTLDERRVNDIMFSIEKLRDRKDLTGRDARILHRDVVMFLGKYGHMTAGGACGDCENSVVIGLKDKLVLNIQNHNEGAVYKLNLQKILQIALQYEDRDLLQKLMAVICSNLWRRDKSIQEALCAVVRALCASHSHSLAPPPQSTSLWLALQLCEPEACLPKIIHYISEERSPGVRKMMSDCLEGLLLKGDTEQPVRVLAERAFVMMKSFDPTTRSAGLDIADTLITAFKDNNLLAKSLLPETLNLIAQTRELDSDIIFDTASKTFIDKIELFNEDSLKDLIHKLLRNLVKKDRKLTVFTCEKETDEQFKMDVIEAKIYRNTAKMVFDFVHNVYNYKGDDKSKILEAIFQVYDEQNGDFSKLLYVLSTLKVKFEFDTNICRDVLCQSDYYVLNKLLDLKVECGDDHFELEAILNFLREYRGVLLELQYLKTLEFVGEIIKRLTPKSIKMLHRILVPCLSVYVNGKSVPQVISASFDHWFGAQPIKVITECIDNELFLTDHALNVYALKIMLRIRGADASTFITSKPNIKTWPQTLLKLYSNDYIETFLKSKMAYLRDLMAVGLMFLTAAELKKIILEGHNLKGKSNEDIGIRFCRFFIGVFAEFLVKKPYILLDEEMAPCCILLNDVLKCLIKKKCQEQVYEDVFELINKLWPTYETQSTFHQKHALLVTLSGIPKGFGLELNPLQWVVRKIKAEETSLEGKTRLISVLPAGEEYESSYRSFASSLPTRVSELAGPARAALAAALDRLAAAAGGDRALLDIVMKLADGDETKGWWDNAIDACMASLAATKDADIFMIMYTRCWEGASLGVCERMVIPFLRYSTSQVCEELYSPILTGLLSKVRKPKVTSAHFSYKKCLSDCTKALNILQLVFEKISSGSLESPNSKLYSMMEAKQSWFLVRQVCKICLTLRNEIQCNGGTSSDIRKLHCAIYKCLCAAICRRQPDATKYYDYILGEEAWKNIVDPGEDISLPLRPQWSERSRSVPVSVSAGAGASASGTALGVTSSSGGTARSRMFVRTLSEEPLLYDLIWSGGTRGTLDTVELQEIQLQVNPLNEHECAATVTATVRVAAGLAASYTQWRDGLVSLLTGEGPKNLKWLLAQAICNCKEELKPHAFALRPALLAVVSDTALERDGKKQLNQLHIDIVIGKKRSESPPTECPPHLNTAIEHLVTTIVLNRNRTYIYRSLMDLLNKLLGGYGSLVRLNWDIFSTALSATATKDDEIYLPILQRIAKNKVILPELLPSILTKLESRRTRGVDLSKLLGLAMAASPRDVTDDVIARYKALLYKTTNVLHYLELLYYVQKEFNGCFDEGIFRKVTNLVNNIKGRDRNKCLKIISCYISNIRTPSEYISDMFDVIDLSELLVSDHAVGAMEVVRSGIHLMGDDLKRRVVTQICEYCSHAADDIRKAAFDVVFAAFEEKFSRDVTEPSAKKLKSRTSTILKVSQLSDVYIKCIVTCLGYGVTDQSDAIARELRNKVGNYLSSDMAIRFAECFLLAVYLPMTFTGVTRYKKYNVSATVSAILEMLFSEMRNDERFKMLKLSEEPLVVNTSTNSKLLSMSRTYQGTFRSYTSTHKRKNTSRSTSSALDVQITIDSIIEVMFEFAKTNPDAAQTLFLEVVRCLLKRGNGFDFGSTVSEQLVHLLKKDPSELTPLLVEFCREVVISDGAVQGTLGAVDKLRKCTLNTEGELVVKTLHEEILLRSDGYQQFMLGSLEQQQNDVIMEDEEKQFSLEGLVSAFGRLSNWDNLTLQQKTGQATGLPNLWTRASSFNTALQDYRVKTGWFDKMVSSYRREDLENTVKWLREIDNWPRNHFAVSAVTEAISWRDGRSANRDYMSPRSLRTDCLAEWSARLMLRAAYIQSLGSEDKASNSMLSRSYELAWCERANEMALSTHVLDCVKRNKLDLVLPEKLSWMYQKLLARRTIGLQRNDSELLQKTLDITAEAARLYSARARREDILATQHLVLALNGDTRALTENKIEDVMKEIEKHKQLKNNYNARERKCLNSIFYIAISFYDDKWNDGNDVSVQNDVLRHMSAIISHVPDFRIRGISLYVDVVFNALDNFEGSILDDDTARNLLDMLQLVMKHIDNFGIEFLRAKVKLFPGHLLNEYTLLKSRLYQEEDMDKYKKYLQLICDPEHTLLQYCKQLYTTLKKKDILKWDEIFERMKDKLFDNPYTGEDFKLIMKYKQRLLDTQDDSSKADNVLKLIMTELMRKEPQTALKISHLCPSLTGTDDIERDKCISVLLGLKNGVQLVKLYEDVQVITDSVNRPVIIKALLSDGNTRRYVHKGGDRLQGDAAAVRTMRALDGWASPGGLVTYNVTPLSEDSGLVEFLEDYKELRSLIPEVDIATRAADDELILSPKKASILQYRQMCEKLPSYSLRSAIMQNSCSIQDFISKKEKFTNTLSSLTIINWLLGVGDRHLKNIMYSIQDGGVCNIDWAANMFRYGHALELPPARLTRALLAACDTPVLEARLQQFLSALRDFHRLVIAVVKTSFNRYYEEFERKLPYIKSILEGKALSYEITKEAILESRVKHTDKYIQLLDDVFATWEKREKYSVEEQVTCLLRQCTDEYILSVTRTGWEPWI